MHATASEWNELSELATLTVPDTLENGERPERRTVFGGLSWARYLAVDRARGKDGSQPRLFYLEGELEIVTTSNEHERILRIVSYFVDEYFEQQGVRTVPRGQATMQLESMAGAEPDDAWCLKPEKEFPDLVLEIALSSGGISKLSVYQRYSIPEVWIWKKGTLHIHLLRPNGSGYDAIATSRIAPNLDLALLARCVAIEDWHDARKAVRDGLGI